MGLICTYIFQSFVNSCNVRYSTKKKNKSCQRCPMQAGSASGFGASPQLLVHDI